MLAVKDKSALRNHLGRLAATPGLIRVIVSHHLPIVDRPAEVLARVAESV
jgi:hypothetical protein